MDAKLVSAVTAAAVLLGVSACTPRTSGPDVDVGEMLPALEQKQTDRDRSIAETEVDLTEHNLSVDDVRYAGSDGAVDYWIGSEDDARVCLFGYGSGDDWIMASGCSSVADFHRQGLGLGIRNDAVHVETYVIPADIDPADVFLEDGQAHVLEEGATILLSVDPGTPGMSPAEVEREDGSAFTLATL